jgi:hypothetical protein
MRRASRLPFSSISQNLPAARSAVGKIPSNGSLHDSWHRRLMSSIPGPIEQRLPLTLAINTSAKQGFHQLRPRILLPPYAVEPRQSHESLYAAGFTVVSSSEEICEAVNLFYGNEDHLIGGMGESDPGVTFIPKFVVSRANDATPFYSLPNDATDLLSCSETREVIVNSIHQLKLQRHGIPFSLHTTGIIESMDQDEAAVWEDIRNMKLASIQISLLAGNPADYHLASTTASESPPKDSVSVSRQRFGQVCGFISHCCEHSIARTCEVAVVGSSLTPTSSKGPGAARSLALSLGAQAVHVY